MIILQKNTYIIYKKLYKYKIYQSFAYQITIYNKHVDAQKTVTLSFREKEKGANRIRFAPFMRRGRLSNLYYLKISHNRKCLLITSLLQS